ncbi:MAG: hypothetical protein AAF415_17455 [Pseudomonadota bacterium]
MGELYQADSLFTLSPLAQAGVLAISALLSVLMLLVMRWAALRLGWWALICLPLAFWAFDWISPQIYYLYYLTVFEGLSWQIVVGWPPPGWREVAAIVTFLGPENLSAHGRGALFWAMLVFMLWLLIRRRRSRRSH